MRKMPVTKAVLSAIVLGLSLAPACALDLKTFVRSDGTGTACTRAAPCASIGAAVAATADLGEINCLDSGPILGGIINKSITIDCSASRATVKRSIFRGAPIAAITVDAPGSAVRLRGLTLDGGAVGIDVVNSKWVSVEKCLIMNFNASPALGIRQNPFGYALSVSDTIIDNNGGAGIMVISAGLVHIGLALNRVRLGSNGRGVILGDPSMITTSKITAVIRDSIVSSNQFDGIFARGPVVLTLERSSIISNVGSGIVTAGGAWVMIGDSTIAGNGTGVDQVFGTTQSFKDNHIAGNTVDGTPIPAFPGPGAPLQ